MFPINKPIWTSSFAVFTAGLALLVWAACVALFDLLGWHRLALPLRIYGVNALTVFVLSGVVGRLMVEIEVRGQPLKQLLYQQYFLSWLEGKNASLAFAVGWVIAWFVVLAYMHRRKWIIKV